MVICLASAVTCSYQVRVAASLPCYSATNVDEQRGRGVFDRSIQVCETKSSSCVEIDPAGTITAVSPHADAESAGKQLCCVLTPSECFLQFRCICPVSNAALTHACHPLLMSAWSHPLL